MARQGPIFIYESEEEEPMEVPFDDEEEFEAEPSDNEADVIPQPEDALVILDTSSDDSDAHSSLAPPAPPTPVAPPVPPMMPAVQPTEETPATYRLSTESPSGPYMRRTPRMCVRHFPPGCGLPTPRDKAPMHEREALVDEPPPKMLRPTHLDWIPPTLSRWRMLEGIPSTFEVGESSSSSPPPTTITGEPVDVTIATLIAVVRSLFGQHYELRDYVRLTMDDTYRLDGNVSSIHEQLNLIRAQQHTDREAGNATRTRVETLERQLAASRVMTGVSIAVAMVAVAFGWFIPRF